MNENIPEQSTPPNERSSQTGDTSQPTFNSPLIGGIVLLLVGVFFLLQNFGVGFFRSDNWWALFILIPAIAILSNAYRAYNAAGKQITYYVRNQIVGGLLVLAVALLFLLGMDWERLWPIFLIVIGIGVMLNAFSSQKSG